MAVSVAVRIRSIQADDLGGDLDGGTIKVYSGAIPADADASLGAAVLLATLTFGTPAFGSAIAGVITANAITADSSADTDGTASFFRTFNASAQVVSQGTVGTTGAFDMVVPTTTVTAGIEFRCTSFTHTVP